MSPHTPQIHSATEPNGRLRTTVGLLSDFKREMLALDGDDELPEYQEREPMNMDAIEAYWRDPSTFIAERARKFAEFNAAMAPHDARVRAKQEARWAREGQS